MDVEWKELTVEERVLLRGLSADLYSLTNEEIAPGDVYLNETSLMQVAQRDYETGDWVSLLGTLRAISKKFPQPVVAYMRGRCWSELGRPEPACWFFDWAHKLDPSQPNYELLALDAMFRSSRRHEAIDKARVVLESRDARPHIVFGAARLLSEIARQLPKTQALGLYAEITRSLRAGLEKVARDRTLSIVPSLVLAARLNLAIAHERLGEMDMARREYDRAVADYPGSDEIIVARAMFLLDVEPDSAYRDLNELVQRGTSNVYPYFFMAHKALIEEHFERCIELCDRVLRNTTQNLMRAHALEWMAISSYERGVSIDAVKELFREAAYLAPLNETIRKNAELTEKLGQPSPPLSKAGFALSRPVRPDDVTMSIQARLSLTPASRGDTARRAGS
jgi:tetratricopeptide (TPR) repeat protein